MELNKLRNFWTGDVKVKDTIEIRWHGRGGQGAKTAALLLADVAFKTGKNMFRDSLSMARRENGRTYHCLQQDQQ